MMNEEMALKLANLLGEYGTDCVAEGITVSEVRELRVKEVVNDIVDSLTRRVELRVLQAARDLT